ncbi:bifunctional helix-turn-helix transcriptional regulator/GNAT family N-acetyltransferase [Rhizobium sp. TH2]|uniref:bifunctional helix-turn-helix transcriptional regulator/GNAT family N-acetyltransferase n=1 Tax=Rhizobium sp. TH2 TaxID=2775403 RepID=UPI0021584DD5|nr:bifunctional helix-turn-helix transcriptional regulator/GNAT family N-acetyltransferase [Rhizobium sp. TH2]
MSAALRHADILSVRDASRKMVRELGFMQPTLAETDLSPSAVHALIEIGDRTEMTANQLGQMLLLEKSTISRLLGRLVERGLVIEAPSRADGRAKILSLTDAGRALLDDIDRFANQKVGRALHTMNAQARSQTVGGLSAYASALQMIRAKPDDKALPVDIHEGFLPGAIGRIAEMHGRYYARDWNMSSYFEARVASGVAEFSQRLDRPMNRLWLAVQAGEIVGSIAVDGEDLGEGKAHVRWVIVDDGLRGAGTGRRLVEAAIKFCDIKGFAEAHLWTFKGLDAARKLYEGASFALTEEWFGDQWGQVLTEQRFVRTSTTRKSLSQDLDSFDTSP